MMNAKRKMHVMLMLHAVIQLDLIHVNVNTALLVMGGLVCGTEVCVARHMSIILCYHKIAISKVPQNLVFKIEIQKTVFLQIPFGASHRHF